MSESCCFFAGPSTIGFSHVFQKTEFCDGGILIIIEIPQKTSKGIPSTPQHADTHPCTRHAMDAQWREDSVEEETSNPPWCKTRRRSTRGLPNTQNCKGAWGEGWKSENAMRGDRGKGKEGSGVLRGISRLPPDDDQSTKSTPPYKWAPHFDKGVSVWSYRR